MIETPRVVHVPARLAAAIHIETPSSKMQQVMGPGIGEVMAAVKAQGIGPAGPWFAHHLRMTPGAFDFEICVPVSAPVTAVGRVTPWQRPAIEVVRSVYQGPYEGLSSAWGEFLQWVAAHEHKTAEDFYECYVVGPESTEDPAQWRTELSIPLVR